MTSPTGLLTALPKDGRDRLLELGKEVHFPAGRRIFEEGDPADRFWILRTGSVTLDMRLSSSHRPTVETLHHGDLLGWSWLVPPRTWHLGAEALSPVRAWEFEAAAVNELCRRDAEFGRVFTLYVAEVVGRRLRAARTRLANAYMS